MVRSMISGSLALLLAYQVLKSRCARVPRCQSITLENGRELKLVPKHVNSEISKRKQMLPIVRRAESCEYLCTLPDCAKQCFNHGSCIETFSGSACLCSPGYAGEYCEQEIEECSSLPCWNNGTCHDHIGSFTCSCREGYSGVFCETENDECLSLPCLNGGTCIDLINSFSCICPYGYNGTDCETEIDNCDSMPCWNGGTCINGSNSTTCSCADGYSGVFCEAEIDNCASLPCWNGGTCLNGSNFFNCTCVDGYYGALCENDIDECASLPCLNGGTCSDEINLYTCICGDGFSGELCEIDLVEVIIAECGTIYTGVLVPGGDALTQIYSAISLSPPCLGYPLTADFDPHARKVYYASFWAINRVNMDGSGLEIILRGVFIDFTLNIQDRKLYWTGSCGNSSRICVASMYPSLTGEGEVFIANVTNPSKIYFDAAQRELYWSEPHKIRRRRLSDENIIDITSLTYAVLSLFVDSADDRVYWSDRDGIHSVRSDGSDHALITLPFTFIFGITVSENILYWTSYITPGIGRVELNTSEQHARRSQLNVDGHGTINLRHLWQIVINGP